MGRNTELQCMRALFGEKLYEIMEEYCRTQNIDTIDFVKECITTVLGVKHIPEHYEPVISDKGVI